MEQLSLSCSDGSLRPTQCSHISTLNLLHSISGFLARFGPTDVLATPFLTSFLFPTRRTSQSLTLLFTSPLLPLQLRLQLSSLNISNQRSGIDRQGAYFFQPDHLASRVHATYKRFPCEAVRIAAPRGSNPWNLDQGCPQTLSTRQV